LTTAKRMIAEDILEWVDKIYLKVKCKTALQLYVES
jgi:hypothetical protein